MPDIQSNQRRRTVLRGASLVLAGSIAGCTSLVGSDPGESEDDNESTSHPSDTPSDSESDPTEETPTTPDGEFPYMRSTSGTTDFGVSLDSTPVMGSDDAPIDMYYWSDYLCPFCSTFALKIHPKIGRNSVADGTLRVVFLQLPNIGKNSGPASILANCVWDQVADSEPNRFWEWHHAVFEQQGEENSGWADIDKLLTITENAGFDTDPLRDCIQNRQDSIKEEIQAEIDLADREKIKGTPAFVLVNKQTGTKQKISGTQPYATFKSTIQSVKNS